MCYTVNENYKSGKIAVSNVRTNGISQPASQPVITYNITTLSTALPIFRTGQQEKMPATMT